MLMRKTVKAGLAAMALGLAACGGGSEIASPGATNPGTPPGSGGGGGGGGSGGGGATCPTGTTNAGALGSSTVCNISGEILTNLTLPRLTGIVYRLNGRVDIGRDLGANGAATTGAAATLTVEPGVTIFGDVAADMLVVNRGSRINAIGTPALPIVFTAAEDITGTANPETSDRLWGGVILLGRAPIRGCNLGVAQGSVDCQNAVEGVTAATGRDALYGGATASDTSGTLRYVQIRYPGAFLTSAAAGDDLNGLTMGGVGSATDISFTQVHNSGDDGIEIFGGAVNMKNIIISGALDDSLDTDEGWQGNVQFLLVRQTVGGRTGGPDRMFEWSNRAVSSLAGTLHTNPTISNFTLVGVNQNASNVNLQAISLNNTGGTPGGSGRLANGVVTGSNVCASLSTANTSPAPRFDSILFNCAGALDSASSTLINGGTNNTTTTPSTLNGFLPGANENAHAALNPTTLGAFFQAANYIGAFASTETATSNWATSWSFNVFPNPGCPTGTTEAGTIAGQRRCLLAGTLGGATAGAPPAAVRLTAGNIYQIAGRVDVGDDRGAAGTAGTAATLTIDPGVTLYGGVAADMIIVNRGSQIIVNGTANQPVVMTSQGDVTNTQATPATASREWGGLILLGRAPIRGCNTAVTAGTVDCQNAIEGVTAATGRAALYGGATPADSSGRLVYLQVKYPGAFLTSAAAGDDLNGITLGGVGSGTQIDNVQVENSGDDGIEVFGGTVNMKHVILTGALDDSLDCDEGWTGKVQFAIIVQKVTQTGGPDRLVECSNRLVSSVNVPANPLNTNPTIANFTFVGIPQNFAGTTFDGGINLNASGGTPGASARFINGVVRGSTNCAVLTAANAGLPPRFDSNLFDCPTQPDATSLGYINGGSSTNNTTVTANSLTSVFVNGPTETGRTAFNASTVDAFFSATTYIGAVQNAADTWWQNWTCGLSAGSVC